MLNNIGLPGILLIAVVVLVLFGRGKISRGDPNYAKVDWGQTSTCGKCSEPSG